MSNERKAVSLEEIKNQVAQERGLKSAASLMGVASCKYAGSDIDNLVNEIARRYAKAVANNALKAASENAKVQYFIIGEKTDVGELTARVDKQSILNTQINIEL